MVKDVLKVDHGNHYIVYMSIKSSHGVPWIYIPSQVSLYKPRKKMTWNHINKLTTIIKYFLFLRRKWKNVFHAKNRKFDFIFHLTWSHETNAFLENHLKCTRSILKRRRNFNPSHGHVEAGSFVDDELKFRKLRAQAQCSSTFL